MQQIFTQTCNINFDVNAKDFFKNGHERLRNNSLCKSKIVFSSELDFSPTNDPQNASCKLF